MDYIVSAAAAGILRRRPGSSAYTWSHEKLQNAEYTLIPFEIRSLLHMLLGRQLWKTSSFYPNEEWMVYLAAEQLNRCDVDSTDCTTPTELAQLNLQAATLSISKSVFYPAVDLRFEALGFAL